ncbi:2-deoxy-D-gluconate 3-dehydrogenase (2-keto-3-deoxygluconate oxidoreductase), partial [Rhizophagus irregularis]
IKGKKILITGGSKGIGKDIAIAFAKLGANIVISGRNAKDLVDTTDELRKLNPNCFYEVADMQKVDDIYRMVDNTVTTLGGIDVLINNAGVNIPKPALEVTEEDWDRVLDTNLKGAFFCSQRAGKYMLEQGYGKIINIASQMAFVGYIDRSAYCSSKGGMMFNNKEFYEDVLKRIPLGKLSQPSDVTGAVVFLASDLSNYITGETIKVDGGWTAI